MTDPAPLMQAATANVIRAAWTRQHVVLDEAYQHGIEGEELVRRCLFACQVQQGKLRLG